VTDEELLETLTKRAFLFFFALALLLARVPHLLAAGANNLAAWALASEWKEVSQQVGFPRCGRRLESPDAARYTAAALRWDPGYGRALVNQGRVAWLEGECSEARANWEQALLAAPGDQVAAFWLFWASGTDTDRLPEGLSPEALAQAAYGAGQYAETAGAEGTAAAWYELSQDMGPSREAANRLARLYQREERLEEAIAVWQRLAAARPQECPDHWWALGQAAELAQEWEQASWAYGRGVEVTSEVAEDPYDFWMRQGVAFERLQRREEAEAAYRQAQAVRPDVPWPYLSLGHLRRKQEDYAGALAWYRQAETVAPEHLAPAYYQGMMYYLLEDYVEARVYLERTLVVNPDHIGSNYYLAQALHQLRERDQAVTFLAQAVALHTGKPWRWVVQLGNWRLELGDREGAMAAYQQALEWRPGESEVERRIEEIR